MTGIFIPTEFLENGELTNTECLVLAIYRYYTLEGKQHCCSLRNEDICKMVRLKDERNLRNIKRHLKDLGYIRTNGGIRVFYIGTKGDQTVTPEGTLKSSKGDIQIPQGDIQIPPGGTLKSSKGDIQIPQGDIQIPPGGTLKSPRGDIQIPHKKEEKRKKENKKEKKEGMEILEQLLKEDDEDFFDKLMGETKDYKNNTIDLF